MTLLKQFVVQMGLRMDSYIMEEWDPLYGVDVTEQRRPLNHMADDDHRRMQLLSSSVITATSMKHTVYRYLLGLPSAFAEHLRCLSLVVDASRIGQSNTLNVIVVASSNQGGVLPPQV